MAGLFEKRRGGKKTNHSGPTGCFWGPLKPAAGTESLGSSRAWSFKSRGLQVPPTWGGGVSGLSTRGVGPRGPEWRWLGARCWKVPSPVHFALPMRADAPGALGPPRLAGSREAARAVSGAARRSGPRAEATVQLPAAGWRASGRLTRLLRGAERRAWDSAGAQLRVALAALSLGYLRLGSAGRTSRTTWTPSDPRAASGSCRSGDAPWPPPRRGRVGLGERLEEEEAAPPGQPLPRPSRLLPAPPGRTRGLGTGTPASERPCPGAAPRARSLAASRAALASSGAGRSHEPGRGP